MTIRNARAVPSRRNTLHSAVLLALGCGGISPAMAQATGPSAAEPATQQITISASRIDRLGFVAPTPTTVLGAATLEQRATVNVGDVLNEVPSFRGSATPAGGGLANNGFTLADLRGLGAQRTLVLLDRKRLPTTTVPGQATTPAGTVNLGMIPTALIRSVDVVTGGASAAYGSDAVAGVVNIVLDDKLQGLKASAQYGATRYDDARDVFLSMAGGTRFADGKGHVVVGGEYNSNSGTGIYNEERDWGRLYFGSITNLPANRAAGVPANNIGPNTGFLFRLGSTGGVVQNAGALNGLSFVKAQNGGVTTAQLSFGRFGSGSFDQFSDAAVAANQAAGIDNRLLQQLRPDIERANVLARVSYQFSDNLSGYLEPLLSVVETNGIMTARRDGMGGNPALRIQADNPYLRAILTPAQLALVPAAGANTQTQGGLALGYHGVEHFGAVVSKLTQHTARLAAGLKGSLNDVWNWDASVTTARNTTDRDYLNNFNNANFRNAVDAITLNGQVVCRSATARAAGCEPISVLGRLTASPQALAYVQGTATGKSTTQLNTYAANIQGEPWQLPAGPVSLGAGIEHRTETLSLSTDALSQTDGWLQGAGGSLAPVKLTVTEAYAETIVPVLKGRMLAKSLDLNAAARITDYSTSGKVNTWKAGVSWEPTDELRIRGTRSRDIRAPTLVDLFTPVATVAPIPLDPRTALSGVAAMTALPTAGGNLALTPESADTTTVGVVIQPKAVKRLSLSADYYDIDVKGAITSTNAATIVSNCLPNGIYSGHPQCSLITFANNDVVNGQILAVSTQLANVGSFKTRGLDVQASYALPLSQLSSSLNGQLNLRLMGTRVFEYRSSADVTPARPNGVNRAGQTGAGFGGPAGLPKWSWTGSADYKLQRLSLNTQVRFISRSRQNNALVGPDDPSYATTLPNSINNNMIPSYTLVNVGAAYDFGNKGQRREVFVSVNNLFDRDPPLPANGSAYYDLMSRSFRLGARLSF